MNVGCNKKLKKTLAGAKMFLYLSSALAANYIQTVPFDQQDGSAANTLYAVEKTPTGRIFAKACNAELGRVISVTNDISVVIDNYGFMLYN